MSTSDATVKDRWAGLEERIGYSFRDRDLLKEAMTHSTYAYEFQAGELQDNERLEFLGDAVLDLIISQHLMSVLPGTAEGDLSKIRADVVSMPSLAKLGRELDVGAVLLLGKSLELTGGRSNPNVLADALEALIGAVFTDGGYESAKKAILPHFIPLLQQAQQRDWQDYKSRLQEVLQSQQGDLPRYLTVETTGPAHDRMFQVNVEIDGLVRGTGHGRTKKQAEQAAARDALNGMDKSS